MGRTRTAVWPKGHRYLGDTQPVYGSFDNHFAGKLHTRCLKVQLQNSRTIETSKSTMEIAAIAVEEPPAQRRQYRIANVAVQPRHGPTLDAALETVSHY